MSNFLTNALALIRGDLEADGIPVLIGALQVLEKPNPLGIVGQAEAAELYLLGNVPAALIEAQTTVLQQAINDLSADLAAIQAKATAAITKAPAKP